MRLSVCTTFTPTANGEAIAAQASSTDNNKGSPFHEALKAAMARAAALPLASPKH